jgi:hypothetical protein
MFFALWIFVFLPFYYNAAPYDESTKCSAKENEIMGFWEKARCDPVAYFTLWLVGFTGVLALSTLGLWIATIFLYRSGERQLRFARDQFLSTHRPKIRVKIVALMNQQFVYPEPLIIRVVCVDYGATEAVIVSYGISLIVVGRGSSLPPDYQIPNIQAGFPVTPGISHRLPEFSHSITEDDEIKIRNGNADLYCLGYLHYVDSIRRSGLTSFCRRFVLDEGKGASSGGHFVRTNDPDYEYED